MIESVEKMKKQGNFSKEKMAELGLVDILDGGSSMMTREMNGT